MSHKFKVGDLVIYQGLVGVVDSLSTRYVTGEPCYNLVSKNNPELSCTANESECEDYREDFEDDSRTLDYAKANGERITNMVEGLTDKYFRDGNH